MDIRQLQKNWDEFGRTDPLYAILVDPDKRWRKWKPAEFFKTGEEDVAQLLAYIESLGVPLRPKQALDFGCGVGRLTQALCLHFETCYGVDIAPSMIDQANHYNRFGEKCQYAVNGRNDLAIFPSDFFDLIYSVIVLQHMAPELGANYIREFVRVLAPGGLLIFQIPSHRTPPPAEEKQAVGAPLPADAFQAAISAGERSLVAEAGAVVQIFARVTNVSRRVWSGGLASGARHEISLGNHWLDESGANLINDDGRAALPADLAPSQAIDLSLTVSIPNRPGRYILDLDMVQEFVAWFADKGSRTARVSVEVRPKAKTDAPVPENVAAQPATDDVFAPRMEMHCIPKEQVVALLEESGARILDTHQDRAAGEAWVSYRYTATK